MGSDAVSLHATAVVSEDAEIGPGVIIGPYAVIEAGARIGNGTRIQAGAVVTGHVDVGRSCEIGHGAVIGGEPQDVSFDRDTPSRLVIGDRTVIREHVTLHRATKPGTSTRVGDDCYLMGHCHVAHDCVIDDGAIVCNGALIAGHVEVGPRAFISGNVVIHQFCRIGELAMIGGHAGISLDAGPYLMVTDRNRLGGQNVVGMRRAGFDADARRRVKAAYQALFGAESHEAGLEAVAAMGLDHPEVARIHAFFASSKRGFLKP